LDEATGNKLMANCDADDEANDDDAKGTAETASSLAALPTPAIAVAAATLPLFLADAATTID
jgi:hypothetical protein